MINVSRFNSQQKIESTNRPHTLQEPTYSHTCTLMHAHTQGADANAHYPQDKEIKAVTHKESMLTHSHTC